MLLFFLSTAERQKLVLSFTWLRLSVFVETSKISNGKNPLLRLGTKLRIVRVGSLRKD